MSLSERYDELQPDEYLDVSYMDDQGGGIKIITQVDPSLGVFDIQGIQLATNNAKNIFKRLN